MVFLWPTGSASRAFGNGSQGLYFGLPQGISLKRAPQVAHNLGINRLGPELVRDATYHQVQNHFGRKWVVASDREVGRRIWWTLVSLATHHLRNPANATLQVELDWNAAPDHRFNHINPRNLSSCAEPAHVNDESLLGHGPIIPESLDVHTVCASSSFSALLLISS